MTPLDLLGEWVLDRVITDRRTRSVLVVHGTTTLAVETDGRVRWHESGELVLPGGSRPVFRTMYAAERDSGWVVLFEDGRDFHPWALGVDLVHLCAPDVYHGRIEASAADWTVSWRVAGPAKDYTSRTCLTRPTAAGVG